jgi:folylpolyglutamate synthase/dihydropteroate synthase
VDIRERIRLDGQPIAEEKYLTYFWQVWDKLAATKVSASATPCAGLYILSHHTCLPHRHCMRMCLLCPLGGARSYYFQIPCRLFASWFAQHRPDGTVAPSPGFFQFMTLLGVYVFVKEDVDAVVLEVGMGGRLDATNMFSVPAVTGVTTLDYDHVLVLGHTLSEIGREVCASACVVSSFRGRWCAGSGGPCARVAYTCTAHSPRVQKAGIFKAGVPALSVPQEDEGLLALQTVAAEVGAPFSVRPLPLGVCGPVC